MVTNLPWIPAALPPASHMHDLRMRAIFEWNKWDQQVADVQTFAGFPIILRPDAWTHLCQTAEKLAREILAAEKILLQNPDLHRHLGFPRQLKKPLRAAAQNPSCEAPRLMRFDFHFTEQGWRISEANTDVPGGLNETSGYPRMLAPLYPGTTPGPDITEHYAKALAEKLAPRDHVALIYATAYTDDHQVMDYLARELQKNNLRASLAGPDQICWRHGHANLVTRHGEEPVQTLVRFFPAEWIPNLPRPREWTHYFAGSKTPISNPAFAVLSQSKRLPLLWQKLKMDMPTWQQQLPTTTEPRSVPWQNDPRWIVKPALGRVGEGIGMKDVLPAKEWKQIARQARWFSGHWVAQERFRSHTLENETGPWYPCIGVYTIDHKAAGAYGRVAKKPLIDQEARDAAILISESTTS